MRAWLFAMMVMLTGAAFYAACTRSNARSEIDDEVVRLMTRHHVPGVSIAVIHEHRLEWANCYGVRAAGESQPIDGQTLFQTASVSKPVTAIAALRLVEQGKLRLDEDVSLRLRSWQVPTSPFSREEKVTLRRLLSHRAGLCSQEYPGYAPHQSVPTLGDILDGRPPAHSPPVTLAARPGEFTCYSGSNYSVLEQLLVDVSGKPFPALMEQLAFAPLQMQHSTFAQPLPAGFLGNVASGHEEDGQPLPDRWHVYPEMAAAGLWSTPTDLAGLLLDIDASWAGQAGTLLSPRMTREMLTPEDNSAWGLGWNIAGAGKHLVFSHIGGNRGYRCVIACCPATGNAAVIMTNSENGAPVAAALLERIRQKYAW